VLQDVINDREDGSVADPGCLSRNPDTDFYPSQKIVTKLSKKWVWDPGSGKNVFWIPDPRVKKAPDPGSGSATLEDGRVKQGN
jgi:hypothetical protein